MRETPHVLSSRQAIAQSGRPKVKQKKETMRQTLISFAVGVICDAAAS
jgi:hypothetical protein